MKGLKDFFDQVKDIFIGSGKFFFRLVFININPSTKISFDQQASFAQVTHSTTMMATITPNRKIPSQDILQITAKHSSNPSFFLF